MAGQLILGLAIMVTLHELGHFMAARAFGIRVEKFYLFFDAWGYKLFSFKKGDTEYGVGWLPLGGYVKIAGMIDESLDKDALKAEPQPWEFRSKPAWQRLIVMVGGVAMNIILGVGIYWMLTYKYGEKQLPISELSNGIVASAAAQGIGIMSGDKIVKINGKQVKYFSELISAEVLLGNAILTIDRDGNVMDIKVPADLIEQISEQEDIPFVSERFRFTVREVMPGTGAEKGGLQPGDAIVGVDSIQIEFYDQFQKAVSGRNSQQLALAIKRNETIDTLQVQLDEFGVLGFYPAPEDFTYDTKTYGLFESLKLGADKAFHALFVSVKGLGKVFKGEVSASKSLHGPIGIAKIYGGEWDVNRFWIITGLLSMVLAFMNMLPIPALDGGHVIFLTIEAVSGYKFSDNFMEKAQITGMIILLALMSFAIGNDVWKLFG